MLLKGKNKYKDGKKKVANFLDSRIGVRKNLFFIVSTLIIFTLMLIGTIPQKVDVKLGQPAPRDIRAPRDIVDEVSTQKLRLEAMESVNTIYNIDTSIQTQIKSDFRLYFKLLRELQDEKEKTDEDKLHELEAQPYAEVDKSVHETLLKATQTLNMTLEDTIYISVNQIMNSGVTKEDVDITKSKVKGLFASADGLSTEMKNAGIELVKSKITVNKFPDVKNTEREKENAAAAVSPVVIREGELIVSENSNINRSIYGLLEKSGLIATDIKGYVKLLFGCLILTLVIESIAGLFIKKFESEVFKDLKKITVIMAIGVLVLLVSKGISGISGYLMPIATASILISIITNERVAIIANTVIGVLIGVFTPIDLHTLFILILSGVIGSFACRNIQQRSNLIVIGFIISIVNMLMILGFGLVDDLELQVLVRRLAYGMLNGVLCSIISIGTLPIWENYFGVLTPLKLLEIMSPGNPLLNRLLLEAPGTYYHSILVGNLAERAANEIGANSLLVRVASYYHDIGKLKRPFFFKENQTDMENPHDKISPSMSKTIITSHTVDGVELAEEYGIPKEISDIVLEHHGTTLASYFYYEALKENPDIPEEEYRYKGRKPQSKEAGIIMIADSVEAACRSVKSPTGEKLQGLIRSIIKSKLDDGQLDESGLTLKDLKTMETSFADTISGVYHDRVEYPSIN